jgi:hypothetical protein
MANPSKLLNAYERMLAAEEEKHRLMPGMGGTHARSVTGSEAECIQSLRR